MTVPGGGARGSVHKIPWTDVSEVESTLLMWKHIGFCKWTVFLTMRAVQGNHEVLRLFKEKGGLLPIMPLFPSVRSTFPITVQINYTCAAFKTSPNAFDTPKKDMNPCHTCSNFFNIGGIGKQHSSISLSSAAATESMVDIIRSVIGFTPGKCGCLVRHYRNGECLICTRLLRCHMG